LRALRFLRILTLLVRGTLTVLLVFPHADVRRREALKQRWSAAVLAALGVRLESAPQPPSGCLVVANHISWLDIFVINAAFPAAFVAKAEVRGWPLIGWLAAKNDTIFLRRGSRGHALRINAEIAAALAAGRIVVVFPEGTTSDGRRVLHFHAALLQAACASGRPVVPLAVAYRDPAGRRSLVPRYDGHISLGESLARLLACRQLHAHLALCPALSPATLPRQALATTARAAIVDHLNALAHAAGDAPLGTHSGPSPALTQTPATAQVD
jgi:1-acyl-sn-glycerol-3-phosphate acyltransferase